MKSAVAPAVPVLVGAKPCPVTCPACKTSIVTKVDKSVNMGTHFMSFCMCAHACGLLCMWMPYCIGSCKNSDHYCPKCQTYLGTYKR
ncbi:hypothetical protein PYW07_015869 [Mythimna separata]|uniref:LITAF domain-containing protein n=1 Tax=Mythimna separata TaxID=271217 RepID=A0AAD7YS18_MYTSE|nr:hypothetical protein PYW07_015869 [Mythimna separata]